MYLHFLSILSLVCVQQILRQLQREEDIINGRLIRGPNVLDETFSLFQVIKANKSCWAPRRLHSPGSQTSGELGVNDTSNLCFPCTIIAGLKKLVEQTASWLGFRFGRI